MLHELKIAHKLQTWPTRQYQSHKYLEAVLWSRKHLCTNIYQSSQDSGGGECLVFTEKIARRTTGAKLLQVITSHCKSLQVIAGYCKLLQFITSNYKL